MKKTVYHIGDTVKIVNPRFVKRVGYPITFNDLLPEFENHPNLKQAMVLLGLADEFKQTSNYYRIVNDFVTGCAKAAARRRGFGGPTRSIHYYSDQDLPFYFDGQVEVLGKRIVKTGTYYPPQRGYSYEEEYEYESGGLSDAKTHILLRTIFGEIEEVDVELVRRGDIK